MKNGYQVEEFTLSKEHLLSLLICFFRDKSIESSSTRTAGTIECDG